MCTQTHTQVPAHMSILIMLKLIYTHLKMDSKQRPKTDEDSSIEQKTWQVYSFVEIKFLSSD